MTTKAQLAAIALVVLSSQLHAAVRMKYMIDEKPTPLAWPQSAFPLHYQIDTRTPLLSVGVTAVRDGFAAWQRPGTEVAFQEQPSNGAAAGRDGINTVSARDGMFDQTGFLAYTTTWDEHGVLQEADIQLDSKVVTEATMQSVVQHEVGHFLGLDHSGNLSAAMYPFVNRDATLSSDDVLGITAIYPKASFAATDCRLTGHVSDGSRSIFGAEVVALDGNGTPVATALTERDGSFLLEGLPPGDYRLYAEPLDGPVEQRNLTGVYALGVSDFRTAFLPKSVHVDVAQKIENLSITVPAGKASLNPRWIGVFSSPADISLTSMAKQVSGNSTISIAVGGDGVTASSTFEAGPLFHRVSEFKYGNGYVYATFETTNVTRPTPVTVQMMSGGETAMLTGALVVQPRASRRRPVR